MSGGGAWSGRGSSYRDFTQRGFSPPAQEIKNQNAMTVSVSKYCREVGAGRRFLKNRCWPFEVLTQFIEHSMASEFNLCLAAREGGGLQLDDTL